MSAGARTLDRDRPRLTGRAAVLLVVVTILGVLAVVPARQLVDQRSRFGELERRAQQLEDENAELRSGVSRLSEPAELERLARACLGMVGPGEVALVVGGPAPDPDC